MLDAVHVHRKSAKPCSAARLINHNCSYEVVQVRIDQLVREVARMAPTLAPAAAHPPSPSTRRSTFFSSSSSPPSSNWISSRPKERPCSIVSVSTVQDHLQLADFHEEGSRALDLKFGLAARSRGSREQSKPPTQAQAQSHACRIPFCLYRRESPRHAVRSAHAMQTVFVRLDGSSCGHHTHSV